MLHAGTVSPNLYGPVENLPLFSRTAEFDEFVFLAQSWHTLAGCNVSIWGMVVEPEGLPVFKRVRYATGPLHVTTPDVRELVDRAFREAPVIPGENERSRYARVCEEHKGIRMQRIAEEEAIQEQLLDPIVDDEGIVSVGEYHNVCEQLLQLHGLFDPWSTSDQCVRIVARTRDLQIDFSDQNRVAEEEGFATAQSIMKIISQAEFDTIPVREVGAVR